MLTTEQAEQPESDPVEAALTVLLRGVDKSVLVRVLRTLTKERSDG